MLFTHSHADHILGLDEMRRFNAHAGRADSRATRTPSTWETLRQTFHYVFDGVPRLGGGIPQDRRARDSPDRSPVSGVRVVPVPVWHGQMPVLGFRFGDFAYLTDCNRLDDASWALVEGVDTLVIDALRDEPHATHFTVSRGARRHRAHAAAARVPDAHDPRSGPRRDQRAPARGR